MTTIHSYLFISVISKIFKEEAFTVAVAPANDFEGSYRHQGYKKGHGRGLQEEL